MKITIECEGGYVSPEFLSQLLRELQDKAHTTYQMTTVHGSPCFFVGTSTDKEELDRTIRDATERTLAELLRQGH